ncbi:unnamed protein product [Clavelina lepadiformis]|uniref:SAM domain-containing protein n=1 Tax=Clavelina lepadiformis TaxID=159417 RepID=A0ABP0GG41_CLALP
MSLEQTQDVSMINIIENSQTRKEPTANNNQETYSYVNLSQNANASYDDIHDLKLCNTSYIDDVSDTIHERPNAVLTAHANVLTLYNVPETNLSTVDEHITENTAIYPQEESKQTLGLKWQNGIAALPGSDLKFRMNVDGDVEIMEGTETFSPKPCPTLNENHDPSDLNANLNASSTLSYKDPSSDIKPILTSMLEEIHSEDVNVHIKKVYSIKTDNNYTVSNYDEAIHEVLPETNNIALQNGRPFEGIKLNQHRRCDFCGKSSAGMKFFGRFCSKVCIGKNAHAKRRQNRLSLDSARQGKRKQSMDTVFADESAVTETGDLKIKIRLPSPNLSLKQMASPNSLEPSRKFNWNDYLSCASAIAASIEPFKSIKGQCPFPLAKNPFKVGWFLEAIDPFHQSLVCLVSVAQILGYRLRLHIEGYPDCYDFWVNADSPFIFPCGFCESTGRLLSPPKGYDPVEFNWKIYTGGNCKKVAPKHCFAFSDDMNKTEFRIGDKVEAVDRKHVELICAATITDIIDDYLLVHFDGWGNEYDYWVKHTSAYIRPIGWCENNGKDISPPLDYNSPRPFLWEEYLKYCGARATPESSFKPTTPNFQNNTKLEVVDKRNSMLIRVATIIDISELQIKVHFDGWRDEFDDLFDMDSPDLHPINWCTKTNHPLQAPPNFNSPWPSDTRKSCPIEGCNGLGHTNGPRILSYHKKHHSIYGCPYSAQNLDRSWAHDRTLLRKAFREHIATPSATFDDFEELDVDEKIMKRKRSFQAYGRQPSGVSTSKKYQSRLLPKRGRRFSDLRSTCPRFPRIDKPKPGNHRRHSAFKRQYQQSGFDLRLHPSFFAAVTSLPSVYLPPCWDENVKLLPGICDVVATEVTNWSVDEVGTFVARLTGKFEYGKQFTQEEIDGESLLLLTQTDLSKVLHIKLGPAIKIYNAILFFKVMGKELDSGVYPEKFH